MILDPLLPLILCFSIQPPPLTDPMSIIMKDESIRVNRKSSSVTCE